MLFFCFQNFDVTGLQLALTEKHSQLPEYSCSSLSVILGDPDPDNK